MVLSCWLNFVARPDLHGLGGATSTFWCSSFVFGLASAERHCGGTLELQVSETKLQSSILGDGLPGFLMKGSSEIISH
jgi:hypothetical protein